MDDLARYYEILGIYPGASADELRQAYRDLVKVWHPDRFSHDEPLRLKAQDKLKEINGAYEVLVGAMFAAGIDPGPQVDPESEATQEAQAQCSAAEGDKPLLTNKVFWAILVGTGAVVFLLTFVTMRRHTGALSQKEETYAQSSADRRQIKSAQGPIIADSIYTVADDFVVDVFHNGERVPDNQRSLIGESFGATCEKMLITVHEGDWLVFNVVNNRFRWNAVYYFAAAGVKGNQTIAFASELESGRWSFCDDARDVTRFIAEPEFLAANRALAVERRWTRGDELMKDFVKQWQGQPVWGTNRNTWIKFRAMPPARPSP